MFQAISLRYCLDPAPLGPYIGPKCDGPVDFERPPLPKTLREIDDSECFVDGIALIRESGDEVRRRPDGDPLAS